MPLAAIRRASADNACALCGQANCQCTGAVDGKDAAQPVDQLDLSQEALAAADDATSVGPATPAGIHETEPGDSASDRNTDGSRPHEATGGPPPNARESDSGEAEPTSSELTVEQQQQLAELKNADREVRAHEQAHLATAGPYAQGGPSYQYQEGPDGRSYAVGGEVSIDASPVPDDPEATIEKAQQVQAAALAPASPSSQDQRVAAAAGQMAAQALAELAQRTRSQQVAAASYGNTSQASTMGSLLDLVA
ncbi:MAG: putative metalloprotease CJM1_0395 family protein [Thermoguttaceae bacterium]